MRVLVTGASGFLGGRVAQLLAEDHAVRGTGRRFTPHRRTELEEAGIELAINDLTDPVAEPSLADILDDVDAVIHCAALSTLWGRWQDLERTNIDAARRLAQECAQRKLRLIHISSPSIYNRAVWNDPAWGTAARPIPEDFAIRPPFDSNYAKSKWLAELAVTRAHPTVCILRPRGIYGPGDTSILPRIIAALQARRLPRLVDREVFTDLTHVDNAAHAAKVALESTVTGAINIADGEPTALWASIDQVADAIGVPRPHHRVPARLVELAAAGVEGVARMIGHDEPKLTATGVRLLTRGMRLDLTRARERLGYHPIHTGGWTATLNDFGQQ